MDYIELKSRYKKDQDYADRTYDLQMYRRVLEGTLYDILQYPFYKDFNNSGGTRKTISLAKRRPSVRYRISKIVVDDSISLLFGEGRFPMIDCNGDETAQEIIDDIIKDCYLNLLMIDAATKGSIGSVAILMKIIEGRLFFESAYTEYLTPIFNPLNPNDILTVTEKCKKSGKELSEKGYDSLESGKTYWWMRIWDTVSETYYIPWEITEDKQYIPKIDKERTIIHNLGFVPIIWIKNLPGNCSEIDGECTFKDAIDTNIELDYQLSQCGRGLKYSSEPLLMIKNPALSMQGEMVVGDGNIIEVDQDGDVKHVEIQGDAARAVIEYAKSLREIALENIHGNRSSPDKIHTVQSGKAMEMLNLPLVWLAAKLRITYGEYGLKKLIYLIIKASGTSDLIVCGNRIAKGSLNKNLNVNLRWPDWFEATRDDRMKDATTLKTLKDAALISQETAIESISDEYDISDIDLEISSIEKEQEEFRENNQPKTTQVVNA